MISGSPTGTKMTSPPGLDPKGSRMIAGPSLGDVAATAGEVALHLGGLDGTLKFFDFHGMSEAKARKTCQPQPVGGRSHQQEAFREMEPVTGKMVHSLSFSTTGGQVGVISCHVTFEAWPHGGQCFRCWWFVPMPRRESMTVMVLGPEIGWQLAGS